MAETGRKVFREEEKDMTEKSRERDGEASDFRSAKISSLAREVMGLARDDILMHLRFFAPVVAALPVRECGGGAHPIEERLSVEEGYFMGGERSMEEIHSTEKGQSIGFLQYLPCPPSP